MAYPATVLALAMATSLPTAARLMRRRLPGTTTPGRSRLASGYGQCPAAAATRYQRTAVGGAPANMRGLSRTRRDDAADMPPGRASVVLTSAGLARQPARDARAGRPQPPLVGEPEVEPAGAHVLEQPLPGAGHDGHDPEAELVDQVVPHERVVEAAGAVLDEVRAGLVPQAAIDFATMAAIPGPRRFAGRGGGATAAIATCLRSACRVATFSAVRVPAWWAAGWRWFRPAARPIRRRSGVPGRCGPSRPLGRSSPLSLIRPGRRSCEDLIRAGGWTPAG